MQQGCQFAEVSAAESSDEVTNAFQTILKEARAWKFERNLPRQRKLSMLAVSKMLNSIMRKTSAPTFPTATQMYVCPDSREALKVRMLKIKLRSLQWVQIHHHNKPFFHHFTRHSYLLLALITVFYSLKKSTKVQLKHERYTKYVTPIIQTHNILTSQNRTHNNPLKPIKELYIIMGSSPSK